MCPDLHSELASRRLQAPAPTPQSPATPSDGGLKHSSSCLLIQVPGLEVPPRSGTASPNPEAARASAAGEGRWLSQ